MERFKGGKAHFRLTSSRHSLLLGTKTGWVIRLTRPIITKKRK